MKIEKIYYKFLSSNLPSLLGKLGKPHYLKFVKLKDIRGFETIKITNYKEKEGLS